jgi:hypothetical protein
LNVGGTIFATTRTTLAKDPDSFLYNIARDDDLRAQRVRDFKASAFSHLKH